MKTCFLKRGATRLLALSSIAMTLTCLMSEHAIAQPGGAHYGQRVPSTVRVMNDRGLKFLAGAQREDGGWPGGQEGPGIVGICTMAFMASGEDPNFGPYAENVRRALRNIVSNQNPKTGYLGNSMYHHGFATLCLSEAYGVVNDRLLWRGSELPKEQQRTLGQALDLAVLCIVTAQKKNQWNAWRYSPTSKDADTTVSGTVLMGLLGARNAGIAVPNEAIDKALGFFRSHTIQGGTVAYQGTSSHGSPVIRTAIATLVYSMGKRKDWPEYKATSEYIKKRIDENVPGHPFYYRYYMAQALFHSDLKSWEHWNRRTMKKLQELQSDNGSFASNHGPAYGTGMSLLAMALNYRLLPVYER